MLFDTGITPVVIVVIIMVVNKIVVFLVPSAVFLKPGMSVSFPMARKPAFRGM